MSEMVFLHLVTGCGVRHGLQSRGGLTNKDVPFTGDRPDGLFGGRTLDPPGVAARNAQQRQLETGMEMKVNKLCQDGRERPTRSYLKRQKESNKMVFMSDETKCTMVIK